MRRILPLLTAALLLAATAGCCMYKPACGTCQQAPETCQNCDGGCRRCCCGGPGDGAANGAATVAYPYYTTRGPRDFLDRSPSSIGP
jgi:hypothetical protein